jgi:tRNA(Ile)-lysidine synthase TilS/MesJ
MHSNEDTDYAIWRKDQKHILSNLSNKRVCVLYSGGKDSSLSLYYLLRARHEFGFRIEVHAVAFPKHRYMPSEVRKLDSFWKEEGVQIQWYNVADSDALLDESENPCLVCQQLRKQVLYEVIKAQSGDLNDLVVTVSYDLSDLVTYLLERLTGHIYVHPDRSQSQRSKERFLETSQRFYPFLRMDSGYSIYRPILRYNEQDVIRIVEEASIPILTAPCRYAGFRPKRLLGAYYDRMGLRFDYDRTFGFAKNHLGLPPMDAYASMNSEHYLKEVF